MAKKPEGTNFDKLLEELNGKKTGAGGENQSAPVQKKSGFVTDRTAERGQIHPDEPSDRPENRYYIG